MSSLGRSFASVLLDLCSFGHRSLGLDAVSVAIAASSCVVAETMHTRGGAEKRKMSIDAMTKLSPRLGDTACAATGDHRVWVEAKKMLDLNYM